MAIISWRMGHITQDGLQRLSGPFVIFQADRVFDIDMAGWDRGIRPGDRIVEVKWKYPQATFIPWQEIRYRKPYHELWQWLKQHAVVFHQPEMGQGWWEWPRLTESVWLQLMEEIIPRWALRIEAGIARHPLLAKWACREGKMLGLRVWKGDQFRAFVLPPSQEEKLWSQIPLEIVPNVSQATRHAWKKRGYHVVGDVPGLLSQVRQDSERPAFLPPASLRIEKTFDCEMDQGWGELLNDLAGRLYQQLADQGQGFDQVRLIWQSDYGTETRERTWPTVQGEWRTVKTRILALLSVPPKNPPYRVVLEVETPKPLIPEQLNWWNMGKKFRRESVFNPPIALSRREVLLQYWDIWRMQTFSP